MLWEPLAQGVLLTQHKLAQVQCYQVIKDFVPNQIERYQPDHVAQMHTLKTGEIWSLYASDDRGQAAPQDWDGKRWAYAAKLDTPAEKKLVPFEGEYLTEAPSCVRLGAWGGEPGEKDHHIQ